MMTYETKMALLRVFGIFLAGVIIGGGIVGAGQFFIRRDDTISRKLDELTGEYSQYQREAEGTIAELNAGTERQLDIIRDLEAGNRELKERIRDARNIAQLTLDANERAGSDIQQAIRLSKVIAQSLVIIKNYLDGRNPDGSWRGNNNGNDNTGEVNE